MTAQLECNELHLGEGENCVESLWVKNKGWAGMADLIVGLYYRSQDQENGVDRTFYKQLEVASQTHVLVPVGDFNHPDICWVSNTAKHAQSR